MIVNSLEKRRRGFSGILAELIRNADAVDYVIKFRSSFNRHRNAVRNFTSVAEVIALQYPTASRALDELDIEFSAKVKGVS